jgi:hypothetical protein
MLLDDLVQQLRARRVGRGTLLLRAHFLSHTPAVVGTLVRNFGCLGDLDGIDVIYDLVIEVEAFRSDPFESVFPFFLVFFGLWLEILHFFDDPERFEDVGDIVEAAGLRLEIHVRVLFLELSYKLNHLLDGKGL